MVFVLIFFTIVNDHEMIPTNAETWNQSGCKLDTFPILLISLTMPDDLFYNLPNNNIDVQPRL